MQTFLPYPDFSAPPRCLMSAGLASRGRRPLQLLNGLSPEYALRGWRNHPARTMWSGHP
ncbi:pyrimidine dimer DNA glycosylase/endonuclease V [Aminivibrio sp.]|uniref:pyrimidine dimer DNA glycosylase/endonuclease V n=1 Tax=Aminivibrio sp. TaxID=1872489 RepID=UPI001A4541E1|nr:pyrimidine dimer DNA glycosylase/endonuclease V [Aminivibrio sp.]MBL3539049.1 hypothetical protein [Aminivibrio sp.]